jgi:hypothetical protein
MNSDIKYNRESIQRLDTNYSELQRASNAQAVQLGRIEEGISGMRRDMQDVLEVIRERRQLNRGE